ncbi:MAG: zinc ribbon domain-containing protein [Clostridia bacterium]|nr:zinc ribbon domain-containing protein [Clostridia bacterium]
MVNCKACGKEIAKGVKKCPHCGKDQRNFFMKHKIITGILVIVLLAALSGVIGGDDKPSSGGDISSKENSKTEENVEKGKEKEEKKTEFKVDEVISYKDFDLIFTNQRNISGINDSEYIVLDVTVVSKKDNFNFFGDVQGVTDDNEVVDNTIAFVEEDLGDPITTAWTKTLNKHQKASGYVAFDKKINKIEIRSDLFSNDVISVIVN